LSKNIVVMKVVDGVEYRAGIGHAVFQAACGRALCVHGCGTVRRLFRRTQPFS
jgi:hypothetical protein